VASSEPASVKLCRIVHRWMASYDAHPYLYAWVYEDPSRLQGIDSAVLDETIDLSQQGYELVREVIAEGVRGGEFRSVLPVGVLAQSAIGLVAWTCPVVRAGPRAHRARDRRRARGPAAERPRRPRSNLSSRQGSTGRDFVG
jgi:hypothetical protein